MKNCSKMNFRLSFTICTVLTVMILFMSGSFEVKADDGEYYSYCEHSYMKSGDKYYIDDVEVTEHEYNATLSCGLTYNEFISGATQVSSIKDVEKHLVEDIHSLKQNITYYLEGSFSMDTFDNMINPNYDDGNTDYTTFYISSYSYTSSQRDGLTRVHFEISYNLTKEEFTKVTQIASDIAAKYNSGSTYDKIKNVHDYLCNTITYDKTLANHSVYTALVKKSTVCEGYAEAFDIIMSYLGIPCKIVQGNINNLGPHEWNNVKLDGKWYHIDCTWDDQESYISSAYFLIGQDRMQDANLAATSYNSNTDNSTSNSTGETTTAKETQAAKETESTAMKEPETKEPETKEPVTQEPTTEESVTEETTKKKNDKQEETTSRFVKETESETASTVESEITKNSTGKSKINYILIIIVAIVLIACTSTTLFYFIKKRRNIMSEDE